MKHLHPLIAVPSLLTLFWLIGASTAIAQEKNLADDTKKERLPHKQTKMPGPPLSPEEALKKITVPDGFRVELVTSEPDLVNPVAMAFDDRGRIWVTESFEYPRRDPGPGRDRVKILEDTNRDGKIDKVKIFADGLNIPSGLAIGHGGVWVANSPDILLLEDTNGDDRADKRTVVVTGFGRDDTHELPNSLTWGPDGWLYGLNGVFNPSKIEQDGKVFQFTCALFRIHPRTRKFELFSEGTSNPWGVAFDPLGSAFVSACVIDHLWHLTETGYYHRQGGPYPPHTWKIESIVEHAHQLAAYCGITYLDSPAYPAEFRDLLVMGNIHGNCINVDRLERNGSTYKGKAAPDFLSGNDVWFMPIVQKVGPDGCLYVLDWYDRYHCYQDARADPEGIDRGHGRLYRVVHGNGQPIPDIRLGVQSSRELVALLGDANVFMREQAQRLLAERRCAGVVPELERLVLTDGTPAKHRMHALWSLISGDALSEQFAERLLEHADPAVRAWGVRGIGNLLGDRQKLAAKVASLASDESLDVLLQVAIAVKKLKGIDPLPVWVQVLSKCGKDVLIPHIVWQNLHPMLPQKSERFLELVELSKAAESPGMAAILPRIAEKLQDQ